ncbi:hypothetical protein FV242_05770 [Methylobacterium sp. WL64]|uniref:BRO family protein n=1 Tax=Methylobacterium sp. WL64 TaxID=2603894 RepID=UPI0011C72481|nr:BRO family protein [Methylobacterium sp. WL64]TXN04860.1 hypothetical protein FV242_05770 [Methylobacterium sp. WL64]
MNASVPAVLVGSPIPTDTSAAALDFRFGLHALRVIVINGAPWFVAKQVCQALQIANARDAVLKLDEDEKGVALTDTPGGPQEVTVISESGLYTLVLRCRGATTVGTLPHRFRRFVTAEVLPEIRLRGSFDVDDNQVLRRMLVSKLDEVDALRAKAKAERIAREAAEEEAAMANQDFLQTSRALTIVTHRAEATAAELAQNRERVEALQPKALVYDRITRARESKTVSVYAADSKVQAKRVFELLDSWGWITRRQSRELGGKKGRWMASSEGRRRGFVEHEMGAAEANGVDIETRQLVITPKGQGVIDAQLAQGRLDFRRRRRA